MTKHTTCPICREEHEPRGLAYDGRGVNSCGMYRDRIATIQNEYHHLGPTLAAAPELLAALKAIVKEHHNDLWNAVDSTVRNENIIAAEKAIAKAEGK